MNKELILLIERYLYTARTTIGRLYLQYVHDFISTPTVIEKQFFCYTLEDTVRPDNIKVYAETALPGGLECSVSLFENAHYGKTLILHTEADKRTVKINNLQWTDCLFHNGVTFEHTMGCVLVGKQLVPPVYRDMICIKEPTLIGGMKEDLRKKVDEMIAQGYTEIKAKFVNLPQVK